MSKQFIISFIFLISSVFSGMSQEAVSSSGGEAEGNGGIVSFTIGQVSYTTNNDASGSVCQGVQHAYEIYSVGIPENKNNLNVFLFPNPFNDNLNLRFPQWKEGEETDYQLFDSGGRLIKKGRIPSEDMIINASELPPAIYFLSISHQEKQTQTFKIIKSKP